MKGCYGGLDLQQRWHYARGSGEEYHECGNGGNRILSEELRTCEGDCSTTRAISIEFFGISPKNCMSPRACAEIVRCRR